MDFETPFRGQDLLARYAQALDDDRLEAWPDFFTDNCRYLRHHRRQYRAGHAARHDLRHLRAMLRDQVRSLRDANVYEAQRYRHMIAPPVIEPGDGGLVLARTSFMVVRIMHTGETTMFVTGRYDDRIRLDGPDGQRLMERDRGARQPPGSTRCSRSRSIRVNDCTTLATHMSHHSPRECLRKMQTPLAFCTSSWSPPHILVTFRKLVHRNGMQM